MTLVWFFVWLIWNAVGDHEPLIANPVNFWLGVTDLRGRGRPQRSPRGGTRRQSQPANAPSPGPDRAQPTALASRERDMSEIRGRASAAEAGD